MTDTVIDQVREDPASLSQPGMAVVDVNAEQRDDPDRSYLFVSVTVEAPPGDLDAWPVDSGLALRRAVRGRAHDAGWEDDVVVIFVVDPRTAREQDLPEDPEPFDAS
ncbi:MAG: hypothetical protein ACRCSN_17250 [Dermatophilaceae bacterium]